MKLIAISLVILASACTALDTYTPQFSEPQGSQITYVIDGVYCGLVQEQVVGSSRMVLSNITTRFVTNVAGKIDGSYTWDAIENDGSHSGTMLHGSLAQVYVDTQQVTMVWKSGPNALGRAIFKFNSNYTEFDGRFGAPWEKQLTRTWTGRRCGSVPRQNPPPPPPENKLIPSRNNTMTSSQL